MSAANILAMAAALLAMHKENQEDPDYEPLVISGAGVSGWWTFFLVLIFGGGISLSLWIALTFGFWWGMLSALVTGIAINLHMHFG